MLFNKKNFKDDIYFDENFFLYLENNDLCLRVNKRGELIYIISQSKIKHDGAKTLDIKYKDQVEFTRNWHWVWSKFYFNKKNYGFGKALKETILIYLSAIIKFLYYSIVRDSYNKKKYFNRASGFFNAFLGKSSWHRPDLKD